jgi:WD40 repeat protein
MAFTNVELVTQDDSPVVALSTSATCTTVLFRNGHLQLQENHSKSFVALHPEISGIVSAISLMPDSKLVFGTARHNRPAHAQVGILGPHTDEVESFFEGLSDEEEQGVAGVTSSPDGTLLFACGGDNQVCAWDRDGRLLWKQDLYEWPYAIDVSADGQTVLVAGWQGYVWGWDAKNGESRRWPKRYFEGPVFDAVFLLAGSDVLVGGEKGTALLWNVQSNEVQCLVGHSDGIHSVAVSQDGNSIFTGSWDATVRLWNKEGIQLAILNLALNAALTGTYDKSVLWPPYAGWRKVGNPAAVHSIALSPSQNILFIGTHGGTVIQARLE